MRILACIVASLLVAYLTLVWTVEHLDALANTACSTDFTLPDIACRIGGFAIILLLPPLAAVVTYALVRRALKRKT